MYNTNALSKISAASVEVEKNKNITDTDFVIVRGFIIILFLCLLELLVCHCNRGRDGVMKFNTIGRRSCVQGVFFCHWTTHNLRNNMSY